MEEEQLPRILYYFRSLMFSVPSLYTRNSQSLFSEFIWSTSGCQVACSTLYFPKSKEGLGVPHLQRYYRAAHLIQLTQIFSLHYRPQWITLEAQVGAPLPIQANLLFWLPPKDRRAIMSPTLSHSLTHRGSGTRCVNLILLEPLTRSLFSTILFFPSSIT